MANKTLLHYYKTGAFARLEMTLDAMSAQGWQVVKAGRLLQRFERDNSAVYRHRIGYCAARKGTADAITYAAAQERAGWTPVGEKKGWILYRRPAAREEDDCRLAQDREPIAALFEKRIKARESFRRWMLVIAFALMLGGYVTDTLPVIYSFAIPMLLALLVTYQIKYMEESLKE